MLTMNKTRPVKFEAIVAGITAGGYAVLNRILPALKRDFPVPLIFVRHIHPNSNDYLIGELDKKCTLVVKQADEKEKITTGHVYFASPNYHLLIDWDHTFSLSVSEYINYARPSIDVLFESASDVYRDKLIGIILTGANNDGSRGLKTIKERGGITIVQDPKSAEMDMMPKSAIETVETDYILPVDEIAPLLTDLVCG